MINECISIKYVLYKIVICNLCLVNELVFKKQTKHPKILIKQKALHLANEAF